MKVEIRKKSTGETAILISFDTNSEAFESPSERNKFFTELHGRRQIIKREQRKYVYRRNGLLDEIPNLRVDNSVFIIMREHMRRMEQFFNEWEDKVNFRTFPVLLNEKEAKELKRKNKLELVDEIRG
ncbi:MAG: hypothetical protein QXU82_02710 [Candidatus Aenigmatarchaeota archaeon]